MRYGYPNPAGDCLLAVQNAESYAATHDSVKGRWVPVPDDATMGATLIEGEWINPPPAEPVLGYIDDVPTFKMRFTPAELVAVRASEDPVVKAFLQEIVDDSRTLHVNREHPFVVAGVSYLSAIDPPLVTADRVAAILAGAPI